MVVRTEEQKTRRREQARAYREANPEKVKASQKAYREANHEKLKAYREANPEKVKASHKAYREANLEKVKAFQKAYREANPEKVKAFHKAWCEANPEKLKAKYETYRDKLSDGYVASMMGLPVNQVPTELLQAKREQLMLHRAIKEFKNTLTEINQGEVK